MNLQDRLQSLVLKAAIDFDTTASKEPDLVTEDDGTLHNQDLDRVLAAQKAKRDALWKELYTLEEQQREMKASHVFDEGLSPERKRLTMHLYEQQVLQEELGKQEKDVHHLNLDTDDLVADLQFRQRLESTVRGMKQLVTFLSAQLSTAKSLHQEEIRVADECGQVKEALTSKIKEIETSEAPSVTDNREKFVKAQQEHRLIMGYLKDFLDEYYPPHLKDGVDPTADLDSDNHCELKTLLEDLVNRSYGNPTNPYIKLVDGTYWSPYIETLIKGGIAERDPQNHKRIRLVDFRIHDAPPT